MAGPPQPGSAPARPGALPLAGCTFGWLHRAPLADALRSLAR